MIDYAHFNPIESFLGGILIGIAVSMLLIINGRIAGVSGIIAGLLGRPTHETVWRALFILGLLLASFLYDSVYLLPEIKITSNTFILVISGLLVGIGTRLGSGCTSGHGICGLSRFSIRSVVATFLFMLAGIITVYVMRHIFGG
ncbi:MAG: YeeE/YedE family protein [Gammaproteobacteria bacterium]